MNKYLEMKQKGNTHYWASRILTEMGYLLKIMEAEEREIPAVLAQTEDWLYEQFQSTGAITKEHAQKAEEMLKSLREDAGRYKIIFAGHAHIDMNWMWGYQETVNLTIDTLQTMLDLMEEYPEFTFSQSQASVYEIIEKYCPSMLPEIRKRVQERRWEVTASTWVELDKNMSGTESMARHILYTKEYLSRLLDIPADSMELDFEPDTFGHSACVPEILSQGGVKYYYHCRGFEEYTLYRWRAPSGAEILVNRDSAWYLGPVEYDRVLYLPDYSRKNHFSTLLYVYGVGDHGGGPTRRDIERIRDMKGWPLMPEIRFGTMHEFFREAEKEKEKFPLVDRELNFVLTGCYTTQSRIKQANRTGEDRLYDSEILSAAGQNCTGRYDLSHRLDTAWKKVLFNQFHDILPGSGVIETREYAMGQFQEAMSYAGGNANRGMKAVGDSIDTRLWGEDKDTDSRSEGAGTGYGTGITTGQWGNAGSSEFGFTQAHRGTGGARVYTLFNTTQYERRELAVVTLWDWKFKEEEISVWDSSQEEVPVQILERGTHYWQHQYIKLAFPASVPALGYAAYCIRRKELLSEPLPQVTDPRVHRMEDGEIVMENEKLRAVFDTETMKLISLKKKDTGEELLKEPSGYFRYVEEDDTHGMTAWIVGGYTRVTDINRSGSVRITERRLGGLRQNVAYEVGFGSSLLRVSVALDWESSLLRYDISADWHETGVKGQRIPQLQFYAPVGYDVRNYLYDIPGGCAQREDMGHDVPGIYFGAALPRGEGSTVFLTSSCKYGYRGTANSLILNLLRGAYDPDPYPDLGIHEMSLGLGVESEGDWFSLLKDGFLFAHKLIPYSNTIHAGTLPPKAQFLEIRGRVKLAAWKLAQGDENSWILRLYNGENKEQQVDIRPGGCLGRKAKKAEWTDLLERPYGEAVPETAEGCYTVGIAPYGLRTIKITLD